MKCILQMELLFVMHKGIGIVIKQWHVVVFTHCSKDVVKECVINIVLSSMVTKKIEDLLIGIVQRMIVQIDSIKHRKNVAWLLFSLFYSCFAWLELLVSVEVINMMLKWDCLLRILQMVKIFSDFLFFISISISFHNYIFNILLIIFDN